MAVPKQRHTKSRRNRRRSHHALKSLGLSECPKCKETVMPHQLCQNCGTYKDREVVDVLAKLNKKERKKKEKELGEQEKSTSSADGQAQSKDLSMESLSKK